MEGQDKNYINLFERMWLIRAFEVNKQDLFVKVINMKA